MPHNSIFIICPEIRAFPPASRQETVHLILIQIHHTAIALIILVINIIDTHLTDTHKHSPSLFLLPSPGRPLTLPVQIRINLPFAHAPVFCYLLHGRFILHALILIIGHMLLDTPILP